MVPLASIRPELCQVVGDGGFVWPIIPEGLGLLTVISL